MIRLQEFFEKNRLTFVALGLIILAVMFRLVPHPANFAPVAAVAIFGGAVLPRRLAVWLPLAVMITSDAIIGFYDPGTMLTVWGCFGLIAFASSFWMRRPTFMKGLGLMLSSSVFFFAATNFASWAFSGMYAHTLTGLARCFVLALPFFRGTVFGDLVYTGTLFGLFALASLAARRRLSPHSKESSV